MTPSLRSQIDANHREIIQRLEAFDRDLKDVEDALYGNGRPGLLDRVTVLETTEEVKKSGSGHWITVISVVVSNLLALIGIFVAMSYGV